MNLFGLNITLSKNGCYVKKEDCHRAMDEQNNRIETIKNDITKHFDTRFEDLKDFIRDRK